MKTLPVTFLRQIKEALKHFVKKAHNFYNFVNHFKFVILIKSKDEHFIIKLHNK